MALVRPAPITRAGLLSIGACALVALLAVVSALAADDPPRKPGEACDAPVRRQFDFWAGDWDVRDPAGKLVGRNRITHVHGNCALEEQWSGNGGVLGSSFSAYDEERERWHQTWVDNTGGLLLLDGGWKDGRMVLSTAAARSGQVQRVTWEPLSDGRVRQLWESSADTGRTWTTVFDGFYARRGSAPRDGVLP
jgi:hypothetical protein